LNRPFQWCRKHSHANLVPGHQEAGLIEPVTQISLQNLLDCAGPSGNYTDPVAVEHVVKDVADATADYAYY
jgi:hypothetical protein